MIDAVLLHLYNLTPEQLGKLTFRQYVDLFDQVGNIKKFDLEGKLELKSRLDKKLQDQAAEEYRNIKSGIKKK